MSDDRDYRRDLDRRDDLRRYQRQERRETSDALRHGITTGDYSTADYLLGVPPAGGEELADPSYYPESTEPAEPGPTDCEASPGPAESVEAHRRNALRLIGECQGIPPAVRLEWQFAVAAMSPESPAEALAALGGLGQAVQHAAVAYAPQPDIWNPNVEALLAFQQQMEALWQGLLGLDGVLKHVAAQRGGGA